MAPRTEPPSCYPSSTRHCQGFTLLEIMLVIVLLGITSTLVVTRMSPNNDALARPVSMLMVALDNALERATQREQVYGLAVAQNSWQLMVYASEPTQESPLSTRQIWRQVKGSRFQLPENAHISLQIEQQDIWLPERLTPEAEPQLWIYPGGETSVFNLRLVQEHCAQHVSASGFMSFQRSEVRCDDD